MNTEKLISEAEYETAISKLAEEKSQLVFPNFGPHNAGVVISNMFRMSKRDVIIYTHSFNKDVARYYINDLHKFLDDKKGKMKILVEKDCIHKNEVIEEISKYSANIEIRVISEKGIDELKREFNNKDCHLSVYDGEMFRLEIDKSSRKALCSFSNKEIAETLTKRFEKIFDNEDCSTLYHFEQTTTNL